MGINPYRAPSEIFQDSEIAAVFEKIIAALNLGNYDRSDYMRDFVDVGHYVELRIGRYDKPFQLAA